MNDHVTIGRYNIYNWHEVHFNDNGSDPGTYMEWQRKITLGKIPNIKILSMLTIYPLDDKWHIHFSNKDLLFNEYLLMFPSMPNFNYPIPFDNAEEAKEHIDLFLDKLSKLKVFL